MTSELQQPQQSTSIQQNQQSALVVHHANTLNHSPRTFDRCTPGSIPPSTQNPNNNNFVIVELHRDDHTCPSFGFNIKGGVESGCPVYIWRVEQGSLADRSGLKSGDEIVQANGISFNGISHAEALKVLKGQTSLTLYIKAPLSSTTPHPLRRPQHNHDVMMQQAIPLPPPLPPPPPQLQSSSQSNQHQSPHHRVEYYTWVDRHGNPVAPPQKSSYTQTRLINLEISPGQNLGLMIRGGSEYGLGIYVTGVDPGSVAERVGLTRGDEILSVNNKNFTRITHDKAVQILKSSKRMQIVASYIGKIPADLHDGEDILKLDEMVSPPPAPLMPDCGDECVDEIGGVVDSVLVDDVMEDHHQVLGANQVVDVVDDASALDLDFVRGSGDCRDGTGANSSGRCTTSILQMIEEKARTVLNKSEHSRFTFYRIEYMQGFLPVVAFVRILLELLNTHEKYTLLTEVRELIRPTDLSQFDELIYSKSTHFRVSSSTSAASGSVVAPSVVSTATGGGVACTKTRSMYEGAPPLQTHTQAQQQQPTVPPPQLPPPPQPPPSFLHHHQDMVVSQQPDEIIMDDFIEHPQNVIGGSEECCFGGGPVVTNTWTPQQQPPQQPTQRINTPFNNQNLGNGNTDRQLLITHDPAALNMQQPTSLVAQSTPSLATRTTPSTSVATLHQTTALLTPNKLATAPTTPGGTLQQGVSNHVLPAPLGTTPTNGTSAASSSVPAVRFKVRITKVKPILGIAIEGGSNTPHRLPRIIDVNPDGSAFHSNLRAGQVLLTVDGKKLDGLTHEEIARLILDCYVDMTKSQIEFLVVEAKQNYYYFNSNQNI